VDLPQLAKKGGVPLGGKGGGRAGACGGDGWWTSACVGGCRDPRDGECGAGGRGERYRGSQHLRAAKKGVSVVWCGACGKLVGRSSSCERVARESCVGLSRLLAEARKGVRCRLGGECGSRELGKTISPSLDRKSGP